MSFNRHIHLVIPSNLSQAVDVLAAETGTERSTVMRAAIAAFVSERPSWQPSDHELPRGYRGQQRGLDRV